MGQPAHLRAGQIALIDTNDYRRVSSLLLFDDVGLEPAVVCGVARAIGANYRQQRAVTERLRMRLVAAEPFGYNFRPRDAAVLENVLVFALDLFAHPGH